MSVERVSFRVPREQALDPGKQNAHLNPLILASYFIFAS